MFNFIKVEGFRSFRFSERRLSPLSVLIGPNGSGKSNFLDLLNLLNQAAYGHLAEGIAARGGFDEVAFKGAPSEIFAQLEFLPTGAFQEEKTPVTFKLMLRRIGANPYVWFEQVSKAPDAYHTGPLHLMHRDRESCMFRSIKTGQREELAGEEGKALESASELAIFQVKDQDKYPTPYKILRQLQEWMLYKDIDVGATAPIRQPTLLRSTVVLAQDGSNLASVLYSIQQQHPATWKEIEEVIETVYPDFHSITFPAEGGDGKVVLRWWERPYEKQGGFSANLLSDGTLKLLCLIAILMSPAPPPLVCIDEPELGLHPDWVKLVGELLQSAATRTQLIVTTHSPQLVSTLEPNQVIVAEKEGGETTLSSLPVEILHKWLVEFNLGELWLSGHFGARP
jgi:predicted ATPase